VTAYATNEEVPGEGIGHLSGVISRPYSERDAYSSSPAWTHRNGHDVLYTALGVPTDPTRSATGVFTSASGTLETNPARVAQPWVALVGPRENRELSAQALEYLNSAEATRAYMGAQNMGAYHVVIPDAPWSQRSSVRVSLPGRATREQLAALDSLAKPYGLIPSDTGNGITFINLSNNRNAAELMEQVLRGEWGRYVSDILGVSSRDLKQVKVVQGHVNYEQDFAKANAGSGKATRKLFENTTPEARAKLDADPAVREEVAGRIKRDADWAAATNEPVRPDIQLARQIFVERGFAGLLDALEKGLPLPVIFAALGLGSTDDTGPGRDAL
jgi:hypothetical protein